MEPENREVPKMWGSNGKDRNGVDGGLNIRRYSRKRRRIGINAIFCPRKEKIGEILATFKNSLYLCTVRMSSEGANDLLSKQNSSWTFLTPIRGHSPQGYVLSFSITSLISCLIVSLSGAEKSSDLITTALLL